MTISITPFEPADETWLRALLATAHLATTDITTEMLGNFMIARDDEKRVGLAGVEFHGTSGLLRSVVVESSARSAGVGSRLVEAIEVRARKRGIRQLFLLTATAHDFFARLGYYAYTRSEAPEAIQATREFVALCPASCDCMTKSLRMPTHHVLFLCTGNSARSILAEAILNHLATPGGSVRAFSAGSHPKSEIHPLALAILEENHLPTAELRTKNWSQFDQSGAPRMDFVITLCDQAAREACPLWPGHPVTTHWGLSDPASVTGTVDTMRQAFREAYRVLHRRIELFLDMPLGESDPSALKARLHEIGQL